MLENFLTIFNQVVILFILIFTGFICGKINILSEQGAKVLTDIVLYLATPCVIIKSFVREFEASLLKDLGLSMLIAALIHVFSIVFVHILFKNRKNSEVLKFACVFSNAGYMALPLQQAILGDSGVFFGASYVAVFNIVLWSYGVFCMDSDSNNFNIKKMLLNPGIIGVAIGLAVFIGSVPLPETVLSPITHLANLNTPLPMLIIGFYLSKINLLSAVKNASIYVICAVRLVAIPLISLLVMFAFGVRSDLLASMTIAASAPTAAATTMFAVRYNKNADLSVSAVSVTTLMSLITMPLIVAFSMVIK